VKYLSKLTCSFLFLTVSANVKAETATKSVLKISLEDAEKKTLENNHLIKRASYDLKASSAAATSAWKNLLPKIEARMTGGTYHDRERIVGESELPKVGRDRNRYQAELVLSQPIFSGFSDTNQIRAKEAAKRRYGMLLDSAKTESKRDVARLYFQIELANLEIDAENEVYELRKQQYQEVKSRRLQGRARELEVLQAEYALKSQIPVIKTLQADLDRYTLQFVRMTDIALDQKFTLTDKIEVAHLAIDEKKLPDVSEAYKRVVRSNSKYNSKIVEVEEAAYKHKAETSKEHFPTVDFVLFTGTDSHLRSDVGSPDAVKYGGELRLTVPLFSGFSSFSDNEAIRNERNSLVEDVAIEREVILEDLTSAYKMLEVAKERITAETLNVELASKSIKEAETLYQSGRATLTDVLDSYRQKVSAKRNLGKAMFDKIDAYIEIRSLMGVPDETK